MTAETTERPILMDGPMVRAILAGAKTQTRRAIKLPHHNPLGQWEASTSGGYGARDRKGTLVPEHACIWHTRTGDTLVCPYGQPGDRLWVREKWARVPSTAYRCSTGVEQAEDPEHPGMAAVYAAGWERSNPGRWRPSIHMPRWACRLVLEITSVRVERLQAIRHRDAIAEGIRRIDVDPGYDPKYIVDPITWAEIVEGQADAYNDARHAFRDLWTSTGGDWDSNPWVWVIEFKRVEVVRD